MTEPTSSPALMSSAPADPYLRTAVGSGLIGFAAVIYALCPVDLIPDVLPFVGWMDDLAVLLAAAANFVTTIAGSLALVRSRAQALRDLQ